MVQKAVTALQARLADQIVQWLKQQGAPQGFRLRESALADQFQVSRSPIRAALGLLEQQGWVESLPYRGVELRVPASELSLFEENLDESDPQDLYMAFLIDRFLSELPAAFSERELQQRYGASRSEVQRLLVQLEVDGIVQPGKGYKWLLSDNLNNAQSHYESYRCRLMMEPAALLEPEWTLDTESVEALLERHQQAIAQPEQVPAAQLFALSADFHELLMHCSGNRFLVAMMKQQNRLRKPSDLLSMQLHTSVEKACRRRMAILEALLQGRNREASELLRALLENDIRVMRHTYSEVARLSRQELEQLVRKAGLTLRLPAFDTPAD
ncbi:GntR family transcriptional regulator [Marinobacterium stanieri]|uniref:Transcriptional regulator, GntR family n=1 Tax=Marinobacterium stanieri TaxID=49186 RepID=A0A1N6QHR3_9GAMM|nr:GntR family transcriptional regulator [Marinobacterium stanieri]SIQ16134.1 transcriptional regulator, GntR family [Marinobacterium stanieri]